MPRVVLVTGKEEEIDVSDLHKITPDRFVTVAGAQFHNLSYQQARMYAVACRGCRPRCCPGGSSSWTPRRTRST